MAGTFTPLGAALWGLGDYDNPDLTFNGVDAAGITWVLGKVDGWKRTTAEVPLQRASGADGGWFGPGTRAPKVLTCTGAFRAPTTALADTAEDQLRAAIEYLTEDQTLWVAGTRPMQMAVRLTGDLDVDDVNPLFRTWTAVLTAADPYRYAAGAAGQQAIVAHLPQLSALPGIGFPLQFPADFGGGDGSVGRVFATNPGNRAAWPVVTYTCTAGVLTNPTLKHLGLQQAEGIQATLRAGDVAVVDHANKTVLLNGQSAGAVPIVGGNTYYPLAPGANDLYFAADNYNAAATCTVTFRPSWS